jgi:ABC-2 type transport system ATP-binding protein
MLDEPANGLDPEGIAWLREFLKGYADAGNTVFVSSHLLSEMSQMADNIIVIAKGKLLADTSVDKLISGSVRSGIFVRVSKQDELEKLLAQKKLKYEKADGGLKLSGVKTDEIGKLAFEAGIPVLELAPHSASLEEAFLELTAGTEEFQARQEAKS